METMKKLFFLLLIFFALFFSPTDGRGQGWAVVFGKITDKQGKPVADVKVSVVKTKISILSSETGEYELTVPSDSSITIEYSHVNFFLIKNVKLAEGEKHKADVAVETTKFLDTVFIEDKAIRTNFIDIISIKNIQYIPSTTGDFNAVIFSQLGVQQSNELSSAYSVRGGNFDENLVYVNDIEVYRPFLIHSGQQEGLSFVNSDMVSSVNFSSGGFEARFGDKMSSVLDIRYNKPREFAGTVSGGLTGATLHLEGASIEKGITYLFGFRQKSNSYLLNSLDTKGDYKPLFLDGQAFITYSPTSQWEHDLLFSAAQNKYRVVPQTRKSSFGTVNEALQLQVYFEGQEIDNYQTLMGAYSAIYRPEMKDLTLKFIASAFRTQESETFDLLGQYYLDELENDFGNSNFGQSAFNIGTGSFLHHARNYLEANVFNFEHKGNKFWKEKNRQLWWGAKCQKEIINDKLSEWFMVDSAGYSLPNPQDSAGYTDPSGQPYEFLELEEMIKSKNDLSSNRFSAYLQHAWNWDATPRTKGRKDSLPLGGAEYTLTAGARFNYWDLNKQLLVSPRVTLAFKPKWKRDVLFKAASGYYYQPPFYRELRDFSGTLHTDLKAQKSIHFVAGTDINFKSWGRPFKFISEIYYKHLTDLIPYEIDNVRIRYYAANNSKGYAAGIDMKVNGEFVKGVDSWASMSIMKTEEDITDDFYYIYLNSDGDTIIPGFTSNSKPTDSILNVPGYIPRPTDQRVTFGLFFQDYLPKLPRCKMHLNLLFGTGLPFGPPSLERYKDVLKMPPYRRVDIGFSYELLRDERPKTDDSAAIGHRPSMIRTFKSVWFSLEVFNLLAVNNVVSYFWVRDVNGRQYAVPNYLSDRLLNARVIVKF